MWRRARARPSARRSGRHGARGGPPDVVRQGGEEPCDEQPRTRTAPPSDAARSRPVIARGRPSGVSSMPTAKVASRCPTPEARADHGCHDDVRVERQLDDLDEQRLLAAEVVSDQAGVDPGVPRDGLQGRARVPEPAKAREAAARIASRVPLPAGLRPGSLPPRRSSGNCRIQGQGKHAVRRCVGAPGTWPPSLRWQRSRVATRGAQAGPGRGGQRRPRTASRSTSRPTDPTSRARRRSPRSENAAPSRRAVRVSAGARVAPWTL